MVFKRAVEEGADYGDSDIQGYSSHMNQTEDDIIQILVRQMNISAAAVRCFFRTRVNNMTGGEYYYIISYYHMSYKFDLKAVRHSISEKRQS